MAEAQASLDFSDPVFKKLSQRNGLVNKMTKDQLINTLRQLGLESRGIKEVLKKRLKAYYKKKMLGKSKVGDRPVVQDHEYLLVIDFEATCEQINGPEYLHEIIEFPIILVDTKHNKVVSEFHSYVKPEFKPKLSRFCISLTGISQDKVDRAPMFPEVLSKVQEWMTEHQLGPEGHRYALVTDGPWDMSRFMANQCHASGIPMPEWSLHWVNVRKLYANFYDCKRQKLSEMVDGLGLSFQGRLHSGIDDAQNIARIAMRMIEDGAVMRVNECLKRLADEDGQPCYEVQNVTTEQAKRRLRHRKVIIHSGGKKTDSGEGGDNDDEKENLRATVPTLDKVDGKERNRNDDNDDKTDLKMMKAGLNGKGDEKQRSNDCNECNEDVNVTKRSQKGVQDEGDNIAESGDDCIRGSIKDTTHTPEREPVGDKRSKRQNPPHSHKSAISSVVHFNTDAPTSKSSKQHEILQEECSDSIEDDAGGWEVVSNKKEKKKQQRDLEIQEFVEEIEQYRVES